MKKEQEREEEIRRVLSMVGVEKKFAVEFGYNGRCKNNTDHLKDWTVVRFDSEFDRDDVIKARLTRENINEQFDRAGIPFEFDFLSIDVNGNDFHLWLELKRRPRVVVIEHNPLLINWSRKVQPYDKDFDWNGSINYGASVKAMCVLARFKGYSFAGYIGDKNGNDLIFARNDLDFKSPSARIIQPFLSINKIARRINKTKRLIKWKTPRKVIREYIKRTGGQ